MDVAPVDKLHRNESVPHGLLFNLSQRKMEFRVVLQIRPQLTKLERPSDFSVGGTGTANKRDMVGAIGNATLFRHWPIERAHKLVRVGKDPSSLDNNVSAFTMLVTILTWGLIRGTNLSTDARSRRSIIITLLAQGCRSRPVAGELPPEDGYRRDRRW